MKKELRYAFGVTVILSVCMSMALWTLFLVVGLITFAFGKYNSDLLSAALLVSPMLAYCWWAWTTKWSIDSIKKLLNNEEITTISGV